MRSQRITQVALACLTMYAFISLIPLESAKAATNSYPQQVGASFDNLVISSNPELICDGSGERSGSHPGWRSAGSINLTLVALNNSTFGVYWCPAAAPSGKGEISYTVTATTSGITCETTDTQCAMAGITEKTPLAIMATDQTGSYPIIGSATQNSGSITGLLQGAVSNADYKTPSLASYGNDASNGIKSCTFAAVANWELVALGLKADPTKINAQFIQAGGVPQGLSNDQVFAYWKKYGIGGVHLKSVTTLSKDPVTLKSTVSDPKVRAVLAQLYFADGQNFGGVQLRGPAYHWVVVSGFTSTGPVVLTWGKALQMTWQQWNVESVLSWKVVTA